MNYKEIMRTGYATSSEIQAMAKQLREIEVGHHNKRTREHNELLYRLLQEGVITTVEYSTALEGYIQ